MADLKTELKEALCSICEEMNILTAEEPGIEKGATKVVFGKMFLFRIHRSLKQSLNQVESKYPSRRKKVQLFLRWRVRSKLWNTTTASAAVYDEKQDEIPKPSEKKVSEGGTEEVSTVEIQEAEDEEDRKLGEDAPVVQAAYMVDTTAGEGDIISSTSSITNAKR